MTSIEILHIGVLSALEMKQQLQTAGLVMDQDFEWSYYQAEYDNFSACAVTPKRVVFSFQDSKLATYYQLKWAQ